MALLNAGSGSRARAAEHRPIMQRHNAGASKVVEPTLHSLVNTKEINYL